MKKIKKLLFVALFSLAATAATSQDKESSVINIAEIEQNFEKIAEFPVVIPTEISIVKFRIKNERKFVYFNKNILDKNFVQSAPLKAGERTAVIYRLKKKMTSEECVSFILAHGQLPGLQGLIIAWEQARKDLPQEAYIIGFDQQENLFKNHLGLIRIPYLYQDDDGYWTFDFDFFGVRQDELACLIIFI